MRSHNVLKVSALPIPESPSEKSCWSCRASSVTSSSTSYRGSLERPAAAAVKPTREEGAAAAAPGAPTAAAPAAAASASPSKGGGVGGGGGFAPAGASALRGQTAKRARKLWSTETYLRSNLEPAARDPPCERPPLRPPLAQSQTGAPLRSTFLGVAGAFAPLLGAGAGALGTCPSLAAPLHPRTSSCASTCAFGRSRSSFWTRSRRRRAAALSGRRRTAHSTSLLRRRLPSSRPAATPRRSKPIRPAARALGSGLWSTACLRADHRSPGSRRPWGKAASIPPVDSAGSPRPPRGS
eukprot:scaffold7329_cov222-Pinguiococcus_pyrenoidosus.AAC.10